MEKTLEYKLHNGLSKEEVKERIDKGLVNGELDVKTKSYSQIIKDNVFTLFNLVNTILAACIAYVGSWKNGLFFLIVFTNSLIGIVQEIRAKHTIERLTLLSAPKAFVLREGTLETIPVKDIVMDDIMLLKNGNQISADAIVLDGECQVNESLVTGESVPIPKKKGDHLLSGSFLVSGKVVAEVEHIGDENYATKITLGAKYYKKPSSVIMRSVKSIVRVMAIAIIPLAILFVLNNFFRVDQTFEEAMVKTVSAIAPMIPGGLVLLVSIVLAVSVVRLAAHKTLVQDLYCVENLARVDVLCLDKTGTITEGTMTVDEVIPLDDCMLLRNVEVRPQIIAQNEEMIRNNAAVASRTRADLGEAISDFVRSVDDENPTINAIRSYFSIQDDEIIDSTRNKNSDLSVIPFSSEKKWSLVYFHSKNVSYILGAAEFIDESAYHKYARAIEEYTGQAKRVVMFAKSDNAPRGKELPENIEPLALIVISDKIRSGAKATLEYFDREEVALKVISGDDPVTVSMVAAEAGLREAYKYIDATELDTYEKIEHAVEEYTIFGRVTPYQKIDIVKALKAHGHTVAMTGDGANDVLALKEADCSIAMQSGAEAARNVSNMVLLNSDFGSLPLVVSEGRKAINNLQRSAALYLTKTTYSFILAFLFIFLVSVRYPFESIQISLIGAVTIGIPSFFLALEPDNTRIRSRFLSSVFRRAIPSGVMMVVVMIISVLFSEYVLHTNSAETSTVTFYASLICSFVVLFNISGKLNLWKGIMIAALIGLAILAIVVGPELFSLVPITWEKWLYVIIISALFCVIHSFHFHKVMAKREARRDERDQLERLAMLFPEDEKEETTVNRRWFKKKKS